MLRLILVLVSLVSLFATASAASARMDYFTNDVIGADGITDRFDAIKLKGYVFRSNALNTKLMETRYFFSKVKREAIAKVQDGTISKYAAADIANSLEYLAYSMNAYFANMKSYERTGRADYKKIALQNLSDANMIYDQLKAATWRSVRQ